VAVEQAANGVLGQGERPERRERLAGLHEGGAGAGYDGDAVIGHGLASSGLGPCAPTVCRTGEGEVLFPARDA
jgi:hypothetical protein